MRVDITPVNSNNLIPEYTSDPASPVPGQTWVLKIANGTPIGLLLALTREVDTYYLSYYTSEGSIVRTQLS